MDKIEIVKEAEKYLTKNLLYGTISGIQVKSAIESSADKIVKDETNPGIVAKMIEDGMYDRNTSELLYVSAFETVQLPLGKIFDVTDIDKMNYIKQFIASIPFSGSIKTGPKHNDILNIEEQLINIVDKMDEEYFIDFNNRKITIKEYYKMLITQEFLPPSNVDKLETALAAERDLRVMFPNYDELANKTINGKVFRDIFKTLPDKMNDDMTVQDGFDVILLGDYLVREFKKISELVYNSVDSKPTNVETISLSMGANNQLEATNEYIFMSEEEENSLNTSLAPKEDFSDRSLIYLDMKNLLEGIHLVINLDTLSMYEDRITKIRNELRIKYTDDKFLNDFYAKILDDYTSKQAELEERDRNLEDQEIVLSNKLKTELDIVNDVKDEYFHTYNNPKSNIEDIKYLYNQTKRQILGLGLQLHYELDKMDDAFKSIEIIANNAISNVDHKKERMVINIDDMLSEAYAAMRQIEYSHTAVEKAAAEVKTQTLIDTYIRTLNGYLDVGDIDEIEYHNYLYEIKKKMNLYGLEDERIEHSGIRRAS